MGYFSLHRWQDSYCRRLENLMLVGAVSNAPDGVIPGGLDNVRDDDENVVGVNFDQREGQLLPLGTAAFEN